MKNYELECQKGSVTTETFSKTMNKASAEAQAYAANIKNGTGSAQVYTQNQRIVQSSMTQTSLASKAAATGLNLFKVALNSIIFFAIVNGISLLVKGIDNLILTADEAEESANNLRSSIQTFFDEINTGNKTISSISNRFDELSKHITKTGKNIDLTEEEYAEFFDICNKVKDIMPELVTGYTSEGDAIITLKDNVDNLSKAYKESIRLKSAMFISKGDENGNTIKSFFDDYNIFSAGEGGVIGPSRGGIFKSNAEDFENYYGYNRVSEWLKKVSSATLYELKTLRDYSASGVYLSAVLNDSGFKQQLYELTNNTYNQVHDILSNRLGSLEQEMSTRVDNIKMSLRQMLYSDKDYWEIDNTEAVSIIDSLFASVDNEFIKQNELFSQNALQEFESNIIKLFQNKSTQQLMIDLYTPSSDNESVSDYVIRIKSIIETIQTYCEENGINIPIIFGNISDTTDDLATKYENAIRSAKEKYNGEDLTSFFEENSINTQEEIDCWLKAMNSTKNLIKAKKKYLKISNKNVSSDLSAYKEQIDDAQTSITSLKSAIESLNKGDLSSSQILDLIQDYKLDAALATSSTEDLHKELERVKQEKLDAIIQSFEDLEKQGNITKEQLEAIMQLFGDISNTDTDIKLDVTDALNKLESTHKTIGELKEEIEDTKTISAATLSDLLSNYPSMEKVINNYLNSLADEKDVLNSLKEAYKNDEDNYRKAVTNKLYENEDYYNQLKLMNNNLIIDFANKYNLDYKNWKSLADAKKSIDEKLIRTLSASWSKYFRVVSDGTSYQLEDVASNPDWGMDEFNSKEYQKALKLANNYKNGLNQAVSELDELANIDIKLPSLSETSANKSAKKDKDSGKKDSKTTFNWIERKLEIIGRQYDILKARASSVLQSHKLQNKELDKAIKKTERQIAMEKKAQEVYKNVLKNVKLSSGLKSKIEHGDVSINDYSEETADKIQKYQDYFDKIKESETKVNDLKLQLAEDTNQKFENIANDIDHRIDLINARISLRQAKANGQENKLDYQYYISQTRNEKEKLETEYKGLKKFIKENKFSTTSDDYYIYQAQLKELEQSIAECDNKTKEWYKNIADLDLSKYDKFLDKLNNIQDELSNAASLLSGDNFDKDGHITDIGFANLTLNFQGMASAKNEIEKYGEKIAVLKNQYLDGVWSLEEYTEKLREYTSAQKDASLQLKDYRDAIIEFKKNAFQEEIEAFEEAIEKQKGLLQAEKDLHDYEKFIQDSTKSIAKLRKEINALSGDESLENQKKLRELKAQLAEAEEALSEKEYDHNIENQEEALDKSLEDFKDNKEKELENLENNLDAQKKSVDEYLTIVKDNYSSAMSTINRYAQEYGIDLTNLLKSPWEDAIISANTYMELMQNASIPTITDKVPVTNEDIRSDNITNGAIISLGGKKAEVLSILQNGSSKEAVTDKTSELNKYVDAQYGKRLGKNDMVRLASLLQVKGVTEKSIAGNEKQKNDILRALKNAGFSKGGIIQKDIQNVIHENGDTSLATVKAGETILTDKFTKLLPDATEIMSKFTNLNIPINHVLPTMPVLKLPETNHNIPDINYNGNLILNLENSKITDPNSLIHAIKSNNNVQREIQKVSWNKIEYKGNLK